MGNWLAVEEMTISASARWLGSSDNSMAKPLNCIAKLWAFSKVRLAMMMRPMPCWDKCRAASSMVSPAPISKAVCSLSLSKICCASCTAAKATDTGLEPMAVSVRTFLAAVKVCWNSLPSCLPKVPASQAAW